MMNKDEISSSHSQLVFVTRIEQPLNHLRREETTKLIKFIPRSSIQLINIHQHPQRSRRSTVSLDRSRNDETSFDINLFNHKSHRRKHKFSKYSIEFFFMIRYRFTFYTDLNPLKNVLSILSLIAWPIALPSSSVCSHPPSTSHCT